jgi:hypothetical protein
MEMQDKHGHAAQTYSMDMDMDNLQKITALKALS